MRHLNFFLLISSLLCVHSSIAEVIIYKPNDHFGNLNPASDWSFGYTSPDDHLNFNLYSRYTDSASDTSDMGNLKVPSLSGYAVWYDWTVSHGYVASGFIGMNRNHNKAVQYLSDFRLKPGQITLHSGINNAHPTIRFTVPHSGFYDIEAIFFAPGFVLSTTCDATTDAHLSVNNVELRSLWVTRKPGLLMLKQFYLNMGDFVQFEVG